MELQKTDKLSINIKYVVLTAIAILILAGTSFFFMNNGAEWYDSINKPFFAPSIKMNMVLWSILYIIIGVSAYSALNSNYGQQRDNIIRIFLINFALLALWFFFLYYSNDTWAAFVDISLLMVCTYFLVKNEYNINSRAAWILIAYFAWIGVMTVLNYNIVMLN